MNIVPPHWDNPKKIWESLGGQPIRRLGELAEDECWGRVTVFLLGQPDPLVLFHVLNGCYLDWQQNERPDEPGLAPDWVIADVCNVFDRQNWELEMDRYHTLSRILWVVLSSTDMYLMDVNLRANRLTIWCGYAVSTTMEWVKERVAVLR